MAEQAIAPTSHSELPPSSADKWFHCHAWRRLTWGLPDESNEAAEEGTEAHEWLAGHLLGERDLADNDNDVMSDHVYMCAEWLQAQDGELHVEKKVDYGSAYGYVDLTGTSDAIIAHPKHLTVADFKYGLVWVDVVWNLQLLIYLIGAIQEFGRRPRYRLVILQPRSTNFDDPKPIREWWITDEELQQFEVDLEKAIAGNYDPRSKAKTGEHCRKWCKALGRCKAAAKLSLSLLALAEEEE